MRGIDLVTVAVAALSLASCRRDPTGSGTSEASSASSTPSAPPVLVFAGQPLVLRDVAAGYERDRLMVRLKVDVPEKREGRVQVPFRASCVADGLRLVHLGRVIHVRGERFDLARTGVGEAFVETGIETGGTRPHECELTFRLAPIGAAKGAVEAREETLCWRDDRVVAGRCGFAKPEPPPDAFAVHRLLADVADDAVTLQLLLQVKDTPKTPTDTWADVRCVDGTTGRAGASIPRSDHFRVEPGEAVPLTLRGSLTAKGVHARCTLELHAAPLTEDVPTTPPTALGTFCADDGKVTPGTCPA